MEVIENFKKLGVVKKFEIVNHDDHQEFDTGDLSVFRMTKMV